MRKRIIRIAAFMLAVVMVLTTSGLSVIAADLFEPSEQASDHAFDAAMVTAMAELCGSREAAEEVLESLYEKGFVDETGMPVESESFNVNGTVMTKEELRAEAETHVFDEQELVMIDGARITWSELKSLFAVMDMQDYIRSAEENGYHLTEQELASFAAALGEGRVKIITQDGKVYLSSGASTHPQGTNVAPEGVARIYLTEVDTDTYTVDFTNTSSDVLARYNLNSFTSMTYQLKPAHVYEEPATGKLYIDTKMTTPVDVNEAARVTIQLTVNALGGSGNFGGGAPVDSSDLTPLGGYRHILTSYRTTDFKVNFTIYAFRDTTVGESSVDLYIENGNLIKPVQISTGGTSTADHVTITFKDGQEKVALVGLTAFYTLDCWDPAQLHETEALELISFFTFRNCRNCVVGIERRHGDSIHYSTVFNFGTYECVPYHVVLDGHDPRTYTEWVEPEDRIYRPAPVSDVTELEPELIIPAGIYHPGDRIPVMIKFNTWIGHQTSIDETSGYELPNGNGFSGTVKLNGHGADNYRFGTDEVFTLTGPMNDNYVNYLYCTYLVKSEVDAATITASALTIGDNLGVTKDIFRFNDSEDPDSVPYTPLTKFTFSNSDFKNAGQATAGNISSPDKTKIFDFAHASLVLAFDNDYYYRVPIVVPKDASGKEQLEYLSWLCADIGSDELGRAYIKSLLSAGTVKNAKGENVSYLNKVYLEVDADTVFEYDDPQSGDHVKFTEKPLYIYLKAELDGSEDGTFGFTAAGVTDRDQNLFGSLELVGLRAIGGKTDITAVLATQQTDTLSKKLASGEWCRFLVTGAVYDGNPSVETYREGFYTRERARAYSKYLVLPCIEFSRIPQKQEDVLLVYSDTWKHYIDPDDTNVETKYNIPKLDPIRYDDYIGEGHSPLTVYYQLTGSAAMTDCSDPEYFVWTSSDPTVATVTNRVDESLGITVGDITLTGKNGTVFFTLTNTDSDLTWTTGSICVIEADPYLYVPATSKPLVTLENYPLDVVFCSNLPTFNAVMAEGSETIYTLNVYKPEWNYYTHEYVKTGNSLLSGPVTATATPDHPVNVLTIPSGVLSEVSASGEVSYVAEITAVYRGPADQLGSDKSAYVSNGDGTYTFSASVPIKVKGAPLKIEMSKNNQHYFLSDADTIEISWEYLGSSVSKAQWIMTVTDEEGVSYVEQGTYQSGNRMKKYQKPTSFILSLYNGKYDGEVNPTNYGIYDYWSGFDNTKLKKTFTVTFAVSTDPENLGYSVASTKIVIYNKDAIDVLVRDTHHSTAVDGDHVVFDNEGYIQGIAAADGTIAIDLAELQNDVTLKSVVSINYGDYVWGLVSDQLQWKVTDKDEKIDAANLYYSQSGVYSNVDRSLLPSYMPISSFMLIGEKEGTSYVTVTHAASGLESTVTVDVHKLENKLFLFQFYPLMKTSLTYTDTKGVQKTVVSKDNGQLALYDPDGIAPGSTLYFSATMGTGEDAVVFAGMKKEAYIESGERNSALGETYPVNVLELTRMEEADLFIKGANGKPLTNQNVTIHGGVYVKTAASGNSTVYENGKLIKIDGYEYKPKMDLLTPAQAASSSENVQGSEDTSNGLEELTFKTDKNGMIRVVLNMDQLRPNFEIQTGEDIMFVFQIEVDGYKPVIVRQKLLGENGERSEAAVVTLQRATTTNLFDPSVKQPFLTEINEYRIINYNRELISIGSEVTALGADTTYPEREVEFSAMLWGYESIIVPSDTDQQAAGADDFERYSVCFSDILKGIEHNKTLGQGAADQHQSIWFYPFSTIPMSTTVLDCDVNSYSITPTKMWLDCKKSTAVDWAIFYDQNADPDVTELKVLRRTRFPYMIANNIDAQILAKDPRFAADIRAYAENMISEEEFGLSDIVPGGDILSACMAFISGLTSGGDHQVNMTVAATADPSVYKVLVIMGDEQGVLDWEDADAGEEKDEGLYTKYGNMDPKDLDEALDKLMGEESKEEEKKDDKVKFKFGGAIIGEARYDDKKDEWSFSVTGGSISLGVEFEVFKVNENFMVGPVPVTVSFEAKAGMMKSFTVDQVYVQRYIDLDGKIHDEPGYDATGYIPWEEYDVVKSYGFMIDSVLSAEVEAFAGVGFDYSVVALKLGISGKFKAEGFYAIGFTGIEERTVRFGAGVSLEGGIALQFKAQLLMLTYVKNIASVSFKAGIQSKGYTELVEMFHSATSKDDTYAGGYAEGSASFMERTVEGSTKKALLRTAGTSIFGQHLETENENFGRVSFSDDGKFIFYTDNLTASFASADGSHIGPLMDVNRDSNSRLPNSEGDFGHFYLDGSGAGDDLFAAWVVQTQTTPRGEKGDEDTLTDLAIALNSTEVVAAVYDGSAWTTTKLSENHAPDMSPTICSNGNKALVAWRSLYGSSSSDPLNFNVDNNIVYRYYDGTAWGETRTLYTGMMDQSDHTTENILSLDSCMLDDGTVVIVYTVQNADGDTDTYYTILHSWNYVANDRYFQYTETYNLSAAPSRTDENGNRIIRQNENAKVISVGDEAILAWYTNEKADGTAGSDIRLHGLIIDEDMWLASQDTTLPESISSVDSSVTVTNNFVIAGNSRDELTLGWSVPVTEEGSDMSGSRSAIYTSRVCKNTATGSYTMSNPVLTTTAKGVVADDFCMTVDGTDSRKVTLVLTETMYTGDPVKAGVVLAEDIIRRTDYSTNAEYEAAVAEFEKQYPEGLDVNRIPGYARLEKKDVTFIGELTVLGVSFDRSTVIPGLTIPVTYSLKNTGVTRIDSILIDGKAYTINLDPNEQTQIRTICPVTGPVVEDHEFTIRSEDGSFEDVKGVLVFNVPKINVGAVTVVSSGEGSRKVSVLLQNDSLVPMTDSGRVLEVSLFTDLGMETQIGETVTVTEHELVDLDAETIFFDVSIADYVKACNEKAGKASDAKSANGTKLPIGITQEIPDEGLSIVAIVRVREDTTGGDGRVLYENAKSAVLKSLITDPETPVYTEITDPVITPEDADNAPEGRGTVTGSGCIRNDSIIDQGTKYYAVTLSNEDGEVIARRIVTAVLTPEHEVTFEYDFTLEALGDYAEITFEEIGDGTLGTPEDGEQQFKGWYKDAAFTEEADADDTVAYAKYGPYPDVEINGANLILDGDICLVFHAVIREGGLGGKMVLSVNGAEDIVIDPADCEKDDKGRYLFPYYLSAIQMAEPVTATYTWGDGETVSKTFSVQDYVEAVVADNRFPTELKDLCKKLINYGHYAQLMTAPVRDWTIGEDYPETMVYFAPTVTDDVFADDTFKVEKTGSSDHVTRVTLSLALDHKTEVYMYLTADTEPEVTVDGETAAVYLMEDGRYRAVIPGVPSYLLAEKHTVIVNDTLTYSLSALCYVPMVLNSSSFSENDKNAVKALYEYYDAGVAYLEYLNGSND